MVGCGYGYGYGYKYNLFKYRYVGFWRVIILIIRLVFSFRDCGEKRFFYLEVFFIRDRFVLFTLCVIKCLYCIDDFVKYCSVIERYSVEFMSMGFGDRLFGLILGF